ncbi:unnamed protein product, partial [Heterotrigona itama]
MVSSSAGSNSAPASRVATRCWSRGRTSVATGAKFPLIFLPPAVLYFLREIFTKFSNSLAAITYRYFAHRDTNGITKLTFPLDRPNREGCVQNGVHHGSETEWTEENDPCRIFSCKAGVITESRLHCYTPCSNPIPAVAGQCCPMCAGKYASHCRQIGNRSIDVAFPVLFAGCHVNGQLVTADRSVTTTEDPCVTCRCNAAGRLTCAKQACPVLHCPGSKIVHDSGECCPRCKGSRRYFSPPKGACMLGTGVYNSGMQFYLDQCTRCSCSNSTVSCVRETCPVHECPAEHQIALPGRCCPQCPEVEEVLFCPRQDGESWKLDSCKACACMQGKVRCAMPMCPPLNLPCPPNSRLEHPEGQCCPRCVESDGVCTVFGDPHYRTFDGKFFSFKGACKYQLASDCSGHTFSVRVTNDARSTRFSAWTKTIAIKMRVKVNGKKVDIPYRVANRLDVNRTADSIVVSTQIGIKVLWDGISFLEVSAPTSYRGRLCGLCGNFNSLPKDDFTNRRGKLLQDAQPFGQSWLVNPTMYYKACLQDMCECPTENCYCESFTAYAHECKRLGIQLPHWRKSTRCRTGWDQFSAPAG